ncbi:metal-dependent hydrolase [Puia sp. P3]|uniref:metal-dependent hydrolase n=1 Tax=Puia sp. P3 TaxID=3423952 RepID=UPI003D66893C
MDSITHIVLGATVGELVAGRRMGKRAMFLGAVANSLPDIDGLASMWLPTAKDDVGASGDHAFFFIRAGCDAAAGVAGPEVMASYRDQPAGVDVLLWSSTFPAYFLDAFNAYGTGWFEPFSHYRVSWNVLFVADPLYTIWLLVTTVVLAFFARDRARRKLGVGGADRKQLLSLLLYREQAVYRRDSEERSAAAGGDL